MEIDFKKHKKIVTQEEKEFLRRKNIEEACIRIFGTMLIFNDSYIFEMEGSKKSYKNYLRWCADNNLIPCHTIKDFEFFDIYYDSFLYNDPLHNDEAYELLSDDQKFNLNSALD